MTLRMLAVLTEKKWAVKEEESGSTQLAAEEASEWNPLLILILNTYIKLLLDNSHKPDMNHPDSINPIDTSAP